jgi:SiaC family regulatory phosphoprotein
MAKLRWEATEKTPLVELDTELGTLGIVGVSIHENAGAFYDVLYDALETYAAAPRPQTHVRIGLKYFNSSSARYLLDILKRLNALHGSRSSAVDLEWNYEEGDLDMQEAGADYKALLDMPVRLVPVR